METRNCSKNSVEMTHAPVAPVAGFKNCCMLSGGFDGSERHDFFQGMNHLPDISFERDSLQVLLAGSLRVARAGRTLTLC